MLPTSNINNDGTTVQELYNLVVEKIIAASLMFPSMDVSNYFDLIVS
jgi:hypothetical protein